MSSLRAQGQNGQYKNQHAEQHKNTQNTKTQQTFRKNTMFLFFVFLFFYFLFSSSEHKVLRVSYCDRPLSVVRRASSVNFFT